MVNYIYVYWKIEKFIIKLFGWYVVDCVYYVDNRW